MIFVCNYTACNISRGKNDSQICTIPEYISKYTFKIRWQSPPSNEASFYCIFFILDIQQFFSRSASRLQYFADIDIYLAPTNISCLSKHEQFQCQPDRFCFPMIRLFYLNSRLEKAMVIWFKFNAMLWTWSSKMLLNNRV